LVLTERVRNCVVKSAGQVEDHGQHNTIIEIDLPKDALEQEPLCEIWDEDVPVMGQLAVALDGSVLVFKEQRGKGVIEVKRSEDGGETWVDAHEDDELFDGPPDVYGCKAALARLPYDDRDVLVFSAPGRRDKRHDITIWVSFDGGQSWPVKRLVQQGPGNYTWLAAGRPGTPSESMIYLLANKDWMARFNLAWVLEHQLVSTGDK
jgi:hypothetical protein